MNGINLSERFLQEVVHPQLSDRYGACCRNCPLLSWGMVPRCLATMANSRAATIFFAHG